MCAYCVCILRYKSIERALITRSSMINLTSDYYISSSLADLLIYQCMMINIKGNKNKRQRIRKLNEISSTTCPDTSEKKF